MATDERIRAEHASACGGDAEAVPRLIAEAARRGKCYWCSGGTTTNCCCNECWVAGDGSEDPLRRWPDFNVCASCPHRFPTQLPEAGLST